MDFFRACPMLPCRAATPRVMVMRRFLLPVLVLIGGCLDSETADLSPPIVTITSPSGTMVSGFVTISASVIDDFGVEKVEFFVGNERILEDRLQPYEAHWGTQTYANGDIQIRVIATDLSGNTGQAAKTVTVNNGPN